MRIPQPPAWAAQAACKGQTALFFPGRGQPDQAARAKAICAGCPVRLECLEAGLDEDYGIWGGLAADERRRVGRRRLRDAA